MTLVVTLVSMVKIRSVVSRYWIVYWIPCCLGGGGGGLLVLLGRLLSLASGSHISRFHLPRRILPVLQSINSS